MGMSLKGSIMPSMRMESLSLMCIRPEPDEVSPGYSYHENAEDFMLWDTYEDAAPIIDA